MVKTDLKDSNYEPEKSSVLQESKIFHESPVDSRKCADILANILYMINRGEVLGGKEATECFFAITKLFQNDDPVLRRMVYLGIKSLANVAEDIIIVTSSLTKDMTGKEESFRASAIRALCCITKDPLMLQCCERYMKQALVDRNSNVASAALVSSIKQAQLSQGGFEVVKRWSNEAIEAVASDDIMVQYHALGFLYLIRKKSDGLAVSKMVSKLIKTQLKSPYALCHLIRIAAQVIVEEKNHGYTSWDFIESCLKHKSEMVVFEAANALLNLTKNSNKPIDPAISALQLFCSSEITTIRFAAVRSLNQISIDHPNAVSACNMDLEILISDSNRSIATLAITTLLKTGAETSIERLMKQIATFVNEISDEFKVVVVKAIKSLCFKFPQKHSILMNFLSLMLREEGGLGYKTCIAETFINLIEEFPDAKESGLAHLCEFIEDCEHTNLAIKVLHIIGVEGPKATNPAKYIRYIFNRVILENAPIRAAAVSTLAKFGAISEELLPNILVLLHRCQLDTDDEVRDRATYYKTILQNKIQVNVFVFNDLDVSLACLERSLVDYVSNQDCSEEFNLNSVQRQQYHAKKGPVSSHLLKTSEIKENILSLPLPEKETLGELFKSSTPVNLTEMETEIFVRCTKHVFSQHLVLQFDCTNTLQDQLLENVSVSIDLAPEAYEVTNVISCSNLGFEEDGSVYVILTIPMELSDWTGAISPTMKFTVRDCDATTGEADPIGYSDEYGLEDVSVNVGDFMQKLTKSNFSVAWDGIGMENEMEETYSLTQIGTLSEAVKLIIDHLGMNPSERTDSVDDEKSTHALLLTGLFVGGVPIMARAKLVLTDYVSMSLCVRSLDKEVSELVLSSIA